MVRKRLDESVRRRLRAGQTLLAGNTPADAAHAVAVAPHTAHTWKAVLDECGIDALRPLAPDDRRSESKMTATDRRKLLLRQAELVTQDAERLAEIEVRDKTGPNAAPANPFEAR